MSELEYVGLVLEDQLLDHLVTPEGATAVWKERLNPDVIPESDAGPRDAVKFVIEYMDEYREPPSLEVFCEEVGYDIDVMAGRVPIAPITYVIEKLRERYRRKEVRKIISKAGNLSSGDPTGALNYAVDELLRVRSATAKTGSLLTSRDLFSTVDDYLARRDNPADGLSFGYPEMDGELGGLRIGEVVVVLAEPKRYKSWQLIKSATENFLAGHEVFFETMELSTKEMRDRFHCMLGGVSWYRFKHNHLTDSDLETLRQVARFEQSRPNQIWFHRASPGERKVPIVVEAAREREAEVLYIDQLSFFDGAKDESGWRLIAQIMQDLKDSSMDFPIMMAAQYNRQKNKEGGSGSLGSIANVALAYAIGETADMLLGIGGSEDMLANKLIHYGIVESRSFEHAAWEVKVELTERSNFKILNVLTND